MSLGLTNALTAFQNLVNDVVRDMLNHLVFVYLVYVLQEHRQHVHKVLERLLQNRLFAKAEQCEFHVDTILFLGYIILPGRITRPHQGCSSEGTAPAWVQ